MSEEKRHRRGEEEYEQAVVERRGPNRERQEHTVPFSWRQTEVIVIVIVIVIVLLLYCYCYKT